MTSSPNNYSGGPHTNADSVKTTRVKMGMHLRICTHEQVPGYKAALYTRLFKSLSFPLCVYIHDI